MQIPKTIIDNRSKFGLVYKSKSKAKINIYADIINKIFGDYNKGAVRRKLQNIKTLVIMDSVSVKNKIVYLIYVKQPYDKLVVKK